MELKKCGLINVAASKVVWISSSQDWLQELLAKIKAIPQTKNVAQLGQFESGLKWCLLWACCLEIGVNPWWHLKRDSIETRPSLSYPTLKGTSKLNRFLKGICIILFDRMIFLQMISQMGGIKVLYGFSLQNNVFCPPKQLNWLLRKMNNENISNLLMKNTWWHS